MTRQLTAPVVHLSLTPHNRLAEDVYHQWTKGHVLLDPPYQRGSVWTDDQRLDLMYSWLSGYPIGALIFNDRMHGPWIRGGHLSVAYAVVDGRQRLETAIAWFERRLHIPASWLPAVAVAVPLAALPDFGDGPYVNEGHLTESGQRRVSSRMPLPVHNAQVDTVRAEAEIYRLVNSGGTAHTAGDLARAAHVEQAQK